MIPLNFLIKPASGACNMRCKYCFYENEVVIRKEDHSVFMTLDTAQLLIYQAFSCIESEKRGGKKYSSYIVCLSRRRAYFGRTGFF